MDEDSQITSSPRILIPESPESPVLETSHNTPRRWPGNQIIETYTGYNNATIDESHEDNAQDVGAVTWHSSITTNSADLVDDDTATTPQALDSSDSNQSNASYQAMRYQPSIRVVHVYNDSGNWQSFPVQNSNESEPSVSTDTDAPWRPSSDLYNNNSLLNEESRITDTVTEESRDTDTINENSRNTDIINENSRNTDIINENSRNTDIVNENSRNTDIVNENSRNTDLVNEESKHPDTDNEEPPAKVRKLNTSLQDDGETCPICLEAWGTSGAHRLVALKCGHLFGAGCVERWLRAQPAKLRTCPTCKSHAALRDVRCLYARRLVAADTAHVTALQRQVELLQTEKNRAELELEKCRIAHRACMMQLEDLRKSLLKNQVREQPQRRSWRFALEKNLEVNRDGGCRVLTYNCRTYELYVSQKSTNYLFPGFGIRKVSCVDYKLGHFLLLHPKPIRDITYSQPRDLLLSVGLDNTARIVERGILSHTIQCGMPLWSCSWDYLRSNEFYVGGIGGVIQQYDVRNPSTYIQKLDITGDLSPVVSLVSTEHGLLSCQLNSCWLWTRQRERKSLPVDGPFMSLCYDNETHKVLVSCRASGNERSRLSLCKLKSVNNSASSSSDVVVEYEQTFPGSARTSLMCKSAFVKAPGARWVASHSESDSSLYLHGVEGSRSMSLPASEPAVDVCAARGDAETVLAALSDSRLRVYRAVPTS